MTHPSRGPEVDTSFDDFGWPNEILAVIEGLSRSFDGRVVLDKVDLTVARGETVALLGASGSGKSTLLHTLAGIDAEATGRVLAPARERAVVFQDHRLLPWKRVWANVVLGMENGTRERAIAALDEVGVAARADAWPLTLSGGEAQRVALARAFVREPALLLLDEPFGALDALTRLRAQHLLVELCQRHQPGVLLVTHDVDEALILADRALVLDNGRISTEIVVPFTGLRSRSDPTFAALREELLAKLGVGEESSASGH